MDGAPSVIREMPTPVEISPHEKTRDAAADGLRWKLERLTSALGALRRQCPEVPILAIPWVHVKHPIHPVQHELMNGLDEPEEGSEDRGRAGLLAGRLETAVSIARVAAGFVYALSVSLRVLWLRWHLRRAMAALTRQRFDVVAEGWRFGSPPRAGESDFYYGTLQRQLRSRGVNLLMLWRDPRQWGWNVAASANGTAAEAWQLPMLALVPLAAPYRLIWRQWRAARRLRRLAVEAADPLLRCVAHRARREILSSRLLVPGLYYWIARAVVRIWRPKALVTLHEGHGWEQCSWWGAKDEDRACWTVGYQHTVLLPHNLELLRPTDDASGPIRPDIVLCLGHRTQRMLSSSHRDSVLIPFGSFRRAANGQTARPPRPERRTVLVLPEGLLDQGIILFGMAIRVARRLPDHRFIWRWHPTLPPLEVLRPHLPEDPVTLPNIEISSSPTIEADFARSSVLLYRGSSAVLYAILEGLKPVYLHEEGHPEIDPAFELEGWRARVDSLEALEAVLRRYAASEPGELNGPWQEAVAYVDRYAIPVDDASIDQFLAVLRLQAS